MAKCKRCKKEISRIREFVNDCVRLLAESITTIINHTIKTIKFLLECFEKTNPYGEQFLVENLVVFTLLMIFVIINELKNLR